MWRIVVSVQLLEVAMLVSEHAARPVQALLRLVEGTAVLALELLIVAVDGCAGQFFLSVGEAALVLVAALCSLNPVLAELSLVFAVRISCLKLMRHHVVAVDALSTLTIAVRRALVPMRAVLAIVSLVLVARDRLWGEIGLALAGQGRRVGLEVCGLEALS